ncbi:MAG: FAD-dependent oxidoreductase [Candidatus Babeliales bacterium]|nr:FAD-dependent oxidoreductase [Candidatus Babeliales bacterium]
MKKIILFLLCVINCLNANLKHEDEFEKIKKCDTDWLIVGAGPAGIATIGVLLDLGTLPKRITWVDPEFNVGKLSNYKNVDANTKNKFFVRFLESCKTFAAMVPDSIEKLKMLNPEQEYLLSSIVEPLEKITNALMNKVNVIQGKMDSLYFENDLWNVGVNEKNITADHVVLATGSYAKRLEYNEYKDKEIKFDDAIDKEILKTIVKKDDVVAVIGSAHSAILLLKYLTEAGVQKIYNFYTKAICYPTDMGGWVLYDQIGLTGVAAYWAKNVLEKGRAPHIERIYSNKENLDKILPICTKIIYAIGFERNKLPLIQQNPNLEYNQKNGVIGKRLFGIGIAFPEIKVCPEGTVEYRIGLPSFLDYAQRVVPTWVKKNNILGYEKQRELLKTFAELFTIEIL